MFPVSPMALPSPEELADSRAVPSGALRALVDALHTADFGSSRDALEEFAGVTVEICAAEAAVVRLAEPEGAGLTAHAVHAMSPSLAAELAGSRVEVGQEPSSSPLEFAFSAPIELDGELAGSLEVLRDTSPFSEGERLLAQLAAGGLALVLRALASGPAENGSAVERALVLAGEALAAGSDPRARRRARRAPRRRRCGSAGGRPLGDRSRRAEACRVVRRVARGGVGGAFGRADCPRLAQLSHPGTNRRRRHRERSPRASRRWACCSSSSRRIRTRTLSRV